MTEEELTVVLKSLVGWSAAVLITLILAVANYYYLEYHTSLRAIDAGYRQQVDPATKYMIWVKPCEKCECGKKE